MFDIDNCMKDMDKLIDDVERLNKENAELIREVKAAQKLCEIYFDIASDIIGPEEVRAKRDDIISNT